MSGKGRVKNTGGGDVFKFTNVGDTLEGHYLGSQRGVGEYGENVKYLFKTEQGIKVVFGSKGLNDILEGENPGPFVTITYVGDKTSKNKGRRPMKMFESTWFDENSLPDSELDSAIDAASSEEPDFGEENPADEVTTAPVRTAPKASAPSASAQAAVQAMLSRKRA